jgi:YtkA-like
LETRAANPHSLRKAAMALNLGDFAMNVFTKQFFAAAGVITTLFASASQLFAGVQDYEFQLVQNEAKKGDAIVAVRLVNKRTGEAVSDAVIAAKRIDMAPDGMADMAGRIEQLPSTEPGVYRFKANLSMQGSWQLSLAAKVQGENGTVESKLFLKVLP